MARLIDADKLPKYTGYALSASEVAIAVENAPTVDAVPVVRCCECKKCATDECYFFARGEWGMSGPDWNFYCADGEREGGDENKIKAWNRRANDD